MTSLYIESENELSINYPAAPADVVGSIPEVIWGKLESYVACRWSTSLVEFFVDAPCSSDWRPPYFPYVIETVDGQPASVNEYGEVNIPAGRHVISCTIGGQPVTPGIEDAYRRLAAYMASEDRNGYSRYSVSLGGEIQESWSRIKNSNALGNSGAAELLTKYRKAGISHV